MDALTKYGDKMKIRNMVPTFRVEVLSYVGDGLVEDTTWKLAGIRNKLEDVYSMMAENHFMRAFLCTPNGREFMFDNMGGGNA